MAGVLGVLIGGVFVLWGKLKAYRQTVSREVQSRHAADDRAAELVHQFDEDRASLHAMLDAANVAMLVLDRTLHTRQANATAARLAGRSQKDLLGLPPGDLLQCTQTGEKAAQCGGSQWCISCPLRLGVHRVFTENTSIHLPEVSIKRRHSEGLLPSIFDIRISPILSEGEPCVMLSINDVTEKRQVERALVLEKDATRAILDASRSQSFLLDPDGHILTANAEAARIADRSVNALSGLEFWALFPAPLAQQRKARFFEAKESDSQVLFEDQDQGESFGLSLIPVRNDVGNLLYVTAHCANITDRKQTQEALRVSEERFRTIAEMSGVYVWELDTHQQFTFLSDKIRDVLGYAPEECVGKDFSFFVPANEVMVLREAFANAIFTGDASVVLEHRALRKGGGEFWMSSHTVLHYDDEGEYCGAFGSSRDVTSRKVIELALQDSEARFRAMASAAQDAIIMVDHRGRILFWNDAGERIFGWNENEIIGRNIHETLLPERYLEHARLGLSQFRESGLVPALEGLVELVGLHRNGSEFPVELAASSIRLDGHWCAVGLVRDITERKRAERALQEAIEHAQAMAFRAQRADAAKSEFLANMSHEIRTPMNGVIGMTSLLLDTHLDAEQRQYTETIRASGEALLAIINDILDFSKIEAGRLELELIDFDLFEAMAEFSELLVLRAEEKGLELSYRVSPQTPRWIKGDPGRLRQILVNLAGNALKFTARGEVNVAVDVECVEERRAVLRFTVQDTGIGIPADRIDSLFLSFSQVDASTTRKYGGTGLGLTISKRLAQMMGGEIGVKSEVGKGSVFWFTAEFEQFPEHPVIDDVTQLESSSVQGSRWLVLDANPGTRDFIGQQLAEWGCFYGLARTASEGTGALRTAQAKGQPFDGILLDSEFLRPMLEIIDAGHRPTVMDKTKLVLKTGPAQREAMQRAREAGFDAVLIKPVVQPATLLLSLRTALEGGNFPEPAIQAQAQDSSSRTSTRHLRILIAEDNVVNQQVARGLLEKMGHRVDCVANGTEALEAVRLHPYDIVFMDCHMPEMDGFEATAAIRALEGTLSHTPITALTANAIKGDREKCLMAGMDEYLAKPLRAKKVSILLDRLFPETDASTLPQEKMPEFVPTVFSPEEFAERIGNNITLVRDTLRSACTLLPSMIDNFVNATRDRKSPEARRHIHSLKGMLANIDAGPLRQLSTEIEQCVVSEDWLCVEGRITELRAGGLTLMASIDQFLNTLPPMPTE